MLTKQREYAIITKVDKSTLWEGVGMIDRFETFATSIALIHKYIQRIKTNEMNALGLKGKYAMCLYSLGKSPDGLTASELCRVCGEDKAAISRAISELEEKELVFADKYTDKRAYRAKVFLTKKGKETISYINQRIEYILDVIGDELSDVQRGDFYRYLALITDNLKSYAQAQMPDK